MRLDLIKQADEFADIEVLNQMKHGDEVETVVWLLAQVDHHLSVADFESLFTRECSAITSLTSTPRGLKPSFVRSFSQSPRPLPRSRILLSGIQLLNERQIKLQSLFDFFGTAAELLLKSCVELVPFAQFLNRFVFLNGEVASQRFYVGRQFANL